MSREKTRGKEILKQRTVLLIHNRNIPPNAESILVIPNVILSRHTIYFTTENNDVFKILFIFNSISFVIRTIFVVNKFLDIQKLMECKM